MGVDEKAGCADERDGGGGNVHLSDALVTGLSGDRGRGVEGGRERRTSTSLCMASRLRHAPPTQV